MNKSSEWQSQAICANEGVDPELFFPVNLTGQGAAIVQQAKAYCKRCPVRNDCEQFAIENGEHHGIWGGLTQDELASERTRRLRLGHAATTHG